MSPLREFPLHPCDSLCKNPALFGKGAIAQLGERYNGIVEVVGSIPIGSTKQEKKISTQKSPYKIPRWKNGRLDTLGERRHGRPPPRACLPSLATRHELYRRGQQYLAFRAHYDR